MTDTPFPGMPDFGGLMEQLQKMQEIQAAEYEGQAGGGVVKITADGAFRFKSVEIAADAVDPDDVEMLQDLVLAALHDLSARLAEAQQSAMGGFDPTSLTDTLGGLGGGLGRLGGLGGSGAVGGIGAGGGPGPAPEE